ARAAKNTLRGVLVPLAFRRRLRTLFFRRQRVIDQVWLHLLVLFEKRLLVHQQVFDHAEAPHGLDGDPAPKVLEQDFAGQAVRAVDQHGVRAAHAVRAGAAVGERAVDVPLDVVQGVEQPVRRLGLDAIFPPPRFFVLLRIEALDFEVNLHSWNPSIEPPATENRTSKFETRKSKLDFPNSLVLLIRLVAAPKLRSPPGLYAA